VLSHEPGNLNPRIYFMFVINPYCIFWQVCDMRWSGDIRCLLLQGVHAAGEGSWWVPENCESGQCEDRSLLWTQEIWFQEKMINSHVLVSYNLASCIVFLTSISTLFLCWCGLRTIHHCLYLDLSCGLFWLMLRWVCNGTVNCEN
jgi:hypothetical protein